MSKNAGTTRMASVAGPLAGLAVLFCTAAAMASGFDLRVAPPAEDSRYLAKPNVVLADGARAVETRGGVLILDKDFRHRLTLRLPGIRSFVSCRATDLVVFTDNSVAVYDAAGTEKARFGKLKEPYPLLVRGDFAGFADTASFREGTTRVTLLTERYETSCSFTVPGRFQLLDPAQRSGVAWLAYGNVPFEPERISIWRGGQPVCDLARPNVRQRLAVFPVAEAGPLYLWEHERDRLALSAVNLDGSRAWRTDLSDSRIEDPKAATAPTGDALAAWGYLKGQQRGEMGIWLLGRDGAVRAKREFRSILDVAFDPSGGHLLVAAAGEVHDLRPADGRVVWRRRAAVRIVSRPAFAFGAAAGTPYLAFLCADSQPDAARGETGRSALEVRELSTGRLLARKTFEGIDSCRIEHLGDERLLLQGDARSWIAEVAH